MHSSNRYTATLFRGEQGWQHSEIHFNPATGVVTMKLLVQDLNGYFIPNIRAERFALNDKAMGQTNSAVEHAPLSVAMLLEYGERHKALNKTIRATGGPLQIVDASGKATRSELFLEGEFSRRAESAAGATASANSRPIERGEEAMTGILKSLKIVSKATAPVALVGLCLASGAVSARAADPASPPPAVVRSGNGTIESYADIVERVAPAVVTVRANLRVRAPQQFPFFDDPFFRQFFGNPNGNRQRQDRSTIEHALGSGVIVSPDGYILTNHHVIDGAEEISVDLNDRRTFTAKVVGSDAPSDLALLKIEATGLPVLPLGDSDKVRVGDVCLAVGYPLDIGETVTAGIISAKGRATGMSDGSFEDFLQTDAAINQGNSGGALVNTRGELIGINSQILSPSGGNIGIGFAIPSNMARNVMGQLRNGGKVHRGRLGVGIQQITSDLAKSMGLTEVRGVLVNSVDPDGPAQRAGVRPGDIILAVNGTRMDDSNELRNYIAGTAPGTEVNMTVLRDGRQEHLQAHLAELPANGVKAGSPTGTSAGHGQLGVTIEPLTPDTAGRLGLSSGTRGVVVTDVDPSGPAADAGIQPNDVILQVNHQPVASAADFRAALQRSDTRPALLLVSRNGQNIFLAVKPR